MYPILFEIFGIQIPTYGLILAVSFLLGLRVAIEYGRREGVSPEQVMNLWLCVLLAGVVGAKLIIGRHGNHRDREAGQKLSRLSKERRPWSGADRIVSSRVPRSTRY